MGATCLRGGKHGDPSVTSPPLRRSPCSSIRKGVPLYGWTNRGEAPRRWRLSEQRLAGFRPSPGAAHAQAVPQHRPPSGPRAPPLRYQAGFIGSLGWVRGPGSPPCTAQDSAFSRGPSFSAGLPPPQRQSAQGRPGHLGPGQVASHGSTPDGDDPSRRVTGPWRCSPLGTQSWARVGG